MSLENHLGKKCPKYATLHIKPLQKKDIIFI